MAVYVPLFNLTDSAPDANLTDGRCDRPPSDKSENPWHRATGRASEADWPDGALDPGDARERCRDASAHRPHRCPTPTLDAAGDPPPRWRCTARFPRATA